MNLLKYYFGITVAIITFLMGASGAHAAQEPTFSSCLAPTGTIKAQYTSGPHGIVGDDTIRHGADTVYNISGDALVQCFCADDGTGIQTNWWKIAGLSDEEIDEMKIKGWIYVPDGAAWGLDNSPYLAKNISYSCKSTSTGGSSSNNSGSSSSTPSESVLGLASTGNLPTVLGILVTGSLSTALGLVLKMKK